ncbi:MAG: orotate phosphoribosyltransferase [Rhodanobacteraceae bacterium]|nr:orotate phosphoribosyltransferase [Rhodanobacteraceae bacterium]MBK7043130.1 orotate phosphoribosyltransferase [Rhodanobacteraceae bacterium]MBP9154208.1 orotate phosphoribosyltransferase [Xanthomonadales bacterium]HQW81374.1 orotate phosphoribosyltransferase [Pseudomonadota bacterium]
MLEHQREFLQLALRYQVLRFGEFTLKSGRISPYFFNAGLFNDGAALAALGRAYATTLTASGLSFDMLFGPAYKGIALATTVAVALADQHGRNVPLAFNRKEAKTHGEGGAMIGAPLAGRVLIIDDVITAGTAVREAISLIRGQGAEPAGVLIALDRQERGQGERSAVEEVRAEFGLPVIAIAGLDELLQLTAEDFELIQHRAGLLDYRNRHGIAA